MFLNKSRPASPLLFHDAHALFLDRDSNTPDAFQLHPLLGFVRADQADEFPVADHDGALHSVSSLAGAHGAIGDLDKALSLYRSAFQGMEKLGFVSLYADSVSRAYADCLEKTGRWDEAEQVWRQWLAVAVQQFGESATKVADAQFNLGKHLNARQRWDEAGTLLGPALDRLLQEQPDLWQTFAWQSALGEAIGGQGMELAKTDANGAAAKFTEAEVHLLAGYQGMHARQAKIPPSRRTQVLPQAVERLVKFYSAWQKPDQAAKWQAELDKLNAEQAALEAADAAAAQSAPGQDPAPPIEKPSADETPETPEPNTTDQQTTDPHSADPQEADTQEAGEQTDGFELPEDALPDSRSSATNAYPASPEASANQGAKTAAFRTQAGSSAATFRRKAGALPGTTLPVMNTCSLSLATIVG